MSWYIPAAIATVVSHGVASACPICGDEATMLYGQMGSGESLRCGRCFDDWAFGDDHELRARMEAQRDEVIGRLAAAWDVFSSRGVPPGVLRADET